MGIACWLALHGELLGGEGMIIIVASLGGRVLSPAVNISSSWNQVIELRSSYQRLKRFLLNYEENENLMTLPSMQGGLSVHNLYVKNYKSDVVLLRNINFDLNPGESLLITGAVGSGKSTLLNAITNLLPLFSGDIRFDGFESKAWNKSQLGLSIGYLPQNIQLLDGTLAENISRFAEPDESLLNVACDLAGIWPLIESLPSGLQTKIGTGENILSGGQRQLVGLARALYGNPKILILDEPNSGLDLVANNNFIKAIEEIKKNGCTILVVSHRTDFLFLIDKILVLSFGNTMSYGPKTEVLEKHRRASNTALQI
jgi:ATP-binding cassette subfamily C exporter for protease/lipase